jgi:hypothetical protein
MMKTEVVAAELLMTVLFKFAIGDDPESVLLMKHPQK